MAEPKLPKRWKKAKKSTTSSTADASTTTLRAASATTLAPATASATAAPAVPGAKVRLRALVIATDDQDYGLPTWTSMLDRVGAPYDVVKAANQPITPEMLLDSAGNGRYNAILLTNSMMVQAQPDGSFSQVVDATEWNVLWAYERDYGVRQATLFASYGTFPEDYCLRAGTEGPVGATPINATLTSAGGSVFDYLKPGAAVPVRDSWVYSNRVDPSCATPLLTTGDATLGVTSTSADGRERAALTFSNNQHLLQSSLLTYGLFRWASKGVFLGQQQHYLKLDVDDYFGGADLIRPDRTIASDAYRMTGSEILNLDRQQRALQARYPIASSVRMGLAYNGSGVSIPWLCNPFGGGVSQLAASTRCVGSRFEWINHTWSHLKMTNASATDASNEIARNNTFASRFPLTSDRTVLKTGEYSGLGVYNPTGDEVAPPTDFGLEASNPNLLSAAVTNGVKFLHGNMSFPSHRPSCFNCAKSHPLSPTLTVVPDWPTNVAYFSSTPAEEETFYNWYYGPGGLFPAFDTPQTYAQIVDNESDIALSHMTTGSVYTHTMHIANLRNYGGGRTLATDWLDASIAKYAKYYSVPLRSPAWGDLAKLTLTRTSHFATAPSVTALYDPSTQTVTATSALSGTVQFTGVNVPGGAAYGSSVMGSTLLTAGVPTTWSVQPLP